MVFDQKNIETLEFNKIRKQVAEYAVSDAARDFLRQIRPSSDVEKIIGWQDETEDGVDLIEENRPLPITRLSDVGPHLKRVEIGASLNGQELAEILLLLTSVDQTVAYFDRLEEDEVVLKRLHHWPDQVQVLGDLTQKLEGAVSASGEILDGASSTLQQIRQGIRTNEGAVRSRLESYVNGNKSRYLTENIITIRNDRYVVPVKAESRGNVKGVVHDQSSSGQTLFIEPADVVDLNNQIRQLQLAEVEEIQRILADLSKEVNLYRNELRNNFYWLTQLDVIHAKARYAVSLQATRPKLSEDRVVRLFAARHPLISQDEVVANDIVIGEDYQVIIITGPNTGGKTITIKTLGLLQMMAQAGLQIPAAPGSMVGIFDGVYADIGDEQSIEQSLSTFSSHMTNIISILDRMTAESLVLIDELGSGTDPQEGAALAIAILDAIREVGAVAMITSHYPELKAYSYNRPDTTNASMSFDIETLQPTYELSIGIPGRSNALEISQRLGLDSDIISRARQLMSGETESVNDMIEGLEEQRTLAREEYARYQEALQETEDLHRSLKKVYGTFVDEREKLMDLAKKEADEKVQEAQEEAEEIIQELRDYQLMQGAGDMGVKEHELIDARTRLDRMRSDEEREKLEKNRVLQKEKAKEGFHPGDQVSIPSLGQNGTLIEKASSDEWMVQLGALRMKVNEDAMEKVASEDVPSPERSRGVSKRTQYVPSELNLIGERYEDAMRKLDEYIDQALLNNHSQVNIIHGHGTGALREGVHKYLRRHPQVESFSLQPAHQGGTGATLVKFKDQ